MCFHIVSADCQHHCPQAHHLWRSADRPHSESSGTGQAMGIPAGALGRLAIFVPQSHGPVPVNMAGGSVAGTGTAYLTGLGPALATWPPPAIGLGQTRVA